MADVSVRIAEASDAASIAHTQADAWRDAYADLLPAELIDGLASAEAQEQWRLAVTSPPTHGHRVLVALSGAAVVGFAAFGPSDDPDLTPAMDADIAALSVAPGATRAGHGSRLVNAAVDHLRGDGFRTAHVWLAAAGRGDDRLHTFLAGAGWEPDGATRELDLHGDGLLVVPQVRLRAAIGEEA